MKRLLLIKSGAAAQNLFSAVGDNFNNPLVSTSADVFDTPIGVDLTHPTLSFFNRTPFTYQLVGNVLSESAADTIAISHYINNPHSPAPDPNLFHPLNTDELFTYADIFDTVIYGVVQHTEVITAANALSTARAFARNATTGDIIDLRDNAIVDPAPGSNQVHIISLFGLVKVQHLPIYCIITDPRMLVLGGNLDRSLDDDLSIRALTEWDTPIRDAIMSSQFSDNVQVLPNNTLFVTGGIGFTIKLFSDPQNNLLHQYNIPTNNTQVHVKSNMNINISNNTITALFPDEHAYNGYIIIKLPGGAFFENPGNPDMLTLTYTIMR